MRRSFAVIAVIFITYTKVIGQCWQSVSPGHRYIQTMKNDGTMWAWGFNGNGELGTGNYVFHDIPIQVNTISDLSSVYGGVSHTAALKSNGTLWVWGRNVDGQLGNGTTNINPLPQQIGIDTWLTISIGGSSTHGIKSDGTLWGWGSNLHGFVGDGTYTTRLSPVQIGNDNTWISVFEGVNNTFAIKSNGTLWGCGWNQYGQVGVGQTGDSVNTMTQIGLENDWTLAHTGRTHTVALKNDGSLWVWGGNTYGQLGDGTIIDKNTPFQIQTDHAWISVGAGLHHTIAVRSDGTLWSWGFNTNGELGNGNNDDQNLPQQIGSDSDWVSVWGMYQNSVAQKADGSLWITGTNVVGQLGIGYLSGPSNVFIPVSCTPLGITDIADESISIGPNPTEDILYINNPEQRPFDLIMYDITGKTIYELHNNVTELDVSGFEKGFYIVMVHTETGNKAFKIFKK
ncbi:hypothetical protein HYN48_14715 [Flavobacterium magnum]|uniref:Uncharacterized protein n=1 Tax=Flavobacterium magnum TaxID=2162713 RepID=A0A2S0RHV2_9FLAO|nr:T9SS type A sorting domain-containing protein [Flavobacterium magnum]AWA31246.1 hypothetical protein HYN48_14715 [Flavobacterium magnum]